MREFGAAAALLAAVATSALAQGAVPDLAARTTAAAAMQARLAAGEVKVVTEEFADWSADCSQAPLDPAPVCRVFARMLLADEYQQLGAVAVTVFTAPEVSVRVASDWQFPGLARLQIDTLPALEAQTCAPNSCTYRGAAAHELIEEFLTGATVLARYEARAAKFEGRLSLATFPAKYGEIARR